MLRVIHNPAAGPKIVAKIDRVKAVLSERGISHAIERTAGPGHAIILAKEAVHAGIGTVLAVGGDGTVNEVANGLAGSMTRLAVVPHGTGNDFADEIGLPKTVEGCLDLLETGKTIEIPLARADERYFVLLASAGFDAEVVEHMTSRQKNFLGIGAYYLAGLKHLIRRPSVLWLEFPGRERVEAQAVLICRGKRYGGVNMAPSGNIEGNSLQVIILRKLGRLSLIRFSVDSLRGTQFSSPDVEIRETQSVFVRSGIPSAAQVDGEYLGPLPARFEMTEARLRIVVPKEHAP